MSLLDRINRQVKRHRQDLANRKVAWKCNQWKETLYWQLRARLPPDFVDKCLDPYGVPNLMYLSTMIRSLHWAKRARKCI